MKRINIKILEELPDFEEKKLIKFINRNITEKFMVERMEI